MVRENLKGINQRIGEAAAKVGRNPEEVRIVAAVKSQGKQRIEEAIQAGITIIGHNYVQEAISEMPEGIHQGVEFHMIGHLQKNKANKAAAVFHVIQTLDDSESAVVLDRKAQEIGRLVGVMIQVNLGEEPQKSGARRQDIEGLIELCRSLPTLRLKGLMTMPPFFDDPEKSRPFFGALRELRDELMTRGLLTPDMNELSMGMTGDFEAAVEEGATLLRIGTALFGPR
jgi:PLP dependent protein